MSRSIPTKCDLVVAARALAAGDLTVDHDRVRKRPHWSAEATAVFPLK